MTEQTKLTLCKSRLAEYLAGKGLDFDKPFNCLNPSHEDKNPSMRFDPKRRKVHCFSCGADYDVIDLVGFDYGLSGKDAFQKAYDLFGLQFVKKHAGRTKNTQSALTRTFPSLPVDYAAYFSLCRSRIQETTYARDRGLSGATLERYGIGYDPDWTHPKLADRAPKAPHSPRLIIPTGPESYIARTTLRTVPKKERPYTKMKVGPVRIFNAEALKTAQKPIFVVEAEMDALSVIEAGGEAIGLGGVGNVKLFLTLIEQSRPEQPLILALDNDEAGQKATKILENELQHSGIIFYRHNIAGAAKDPSEALEHDRDGFIIRVHEGETLDVDTRSGEREAYLKTSAVSRLPFFMGGPEEGAHTPAVSTGFVALDAMLDGGLHEGLYVLGAVSGFGKTTLVLQVMDQIAQAGHDALFFSLEMGRDELIAKSLSRHTMREAMRIGNGCLARTTREITDANRRWRRDGSEVIHAAITRYQDYAHRIFIVECMGNIGAKDVREAVCNHIHLTGNRPVVFVDYMQLLSPASERMTDKQNMDRSVMELKRISRDHKTAVIAISSMNRAGYGEAVKMEGFKESGGIEYSADVLLGLQYAGMDKKDAYKDARFNELKNKNPREVELAVLKNRNGPAGGKVLFKYYAAYNCFQDE